MFDANGDDQRLCPATDDATKSWRFTPPMERTGGNFTIVGNEDFSAFSCLIPVDLDGSLRVDINRSLVINGSLTVIYSYMGIDTTLSIVYGMLCMYSLRPNISLLTVTYPV